MILLNEIAEKLQNILNGTDTETQQLQNPTDFQYMVATKGFHLDKIYDKTTGKNFIPVFIDSRGGQYNPVPGLNQANYAVSIVFYFPVRFKESFFALNSFLVAAFVGSTLNYGTYTGKAVSNISVANYGEIQSLDLKEFAEWVENIYRMPIEVMEEYMSMEITLFLSNAGTDFVYGNAANISLEFKIGQTTYKDQCVTFEEATIQSQSQTQSEQLEGESEAQGIPFGTAYGSGFSCYYKSNSFYKKLLEKWFAGTIQDLTIKFTLTLDSYTFTRNCYLESIMMPIRKGQLITFTFSFAKKLEVD